MNTGAPLPTGQAYLFVHDARTAPLLLGASSPCLSSHRCHLLHSRTSHAGLCH